MITSFDKNEKKMLKFCDLIWNQLINSNEFNVLIVNWKDYKYFNEFESEETTFWNEQI